jgi:hypothetical protein
MQLGLKPCSFRVSILPTTSPGNQIINVRSLRCNKNRSVVVMDNHPGFFGGLKVRPQPLKVLRL